MKKNNAVIFSQYFQNRYIQDIADVMVHSMYFVQQRMRTVVDFILCSSVHFITKQ